MSKRLFNDDSSWTPDAHHTYNRVVAAIVEILEESDVDFRDFHFIAINAVSEVVAKAAIRKRLE